MTLSNEKENKDYRYSSNKLFTIVSMLIHTRNATSVSEVWFKELGILTQTIARNEVDVRVRVSDGFRAKALRPALLWLTKCYEPTNEGGRENNGSLNRSFTGHTSRGFQRQGLLNRNR